MSKNYLAHDMRLVINGLLKVAKSGTAIQQAKAETIINNSSVRKAVENAPETIKKILPSDVGDILQRASMIPVGIQQFASIAPKYILPEGFSRMRDSEMKSHVLPNLVEEEEILTIREEDLEGIYIQSLGVELLQQNADGRRYEQEQDIKDLGAKDRQSSTDPAANVRSTKELLKDKAVSSSQPDKSPEEVAHPRNNNFMQSSVAGAINHLASSTSSDEKPSPQISSELYNPIVTPPSAIKLSSLVKPLSKNKPVSQLSKLSKQRKVPATRISRLVSYGGLAAGLGIGALTEVTKRTLGLGNPNSNDSLLNSSPFLTEANAERIVDTLCRVRGAALKIGQILSIQDNSMMNPQLQRVFERVRHAADFMPDWQMEKMLLSDLGSDWRSKLDEFDTKPFAAASIGQVHLGKLHDGRPVAIKIQYPGVGQGINSDIDNLMSVLGVWNIIPEGVFIDNVIGVAKRELAWEVDYIREAKCAKRFRKFLEPYPDYYVPDVIDELTTKQIYATELIEGIPVDKCASMDQETRNHICFLMLDLFFRELFEFQFMQTDPNWANFLYNAETRQIGLLDFGASRDYKNSFVDNYMRILKGAADGDKETILHYSRKIGFLSGYESKLMENAHTESVLLLGEALRTGDKPYDFGSQDLTLRIQRLVPVMVKERLCPPPEEIYSLHRKLSGVFLLCSKLKGQVICRPILERVMQNYKFDRPDTKSELNV